MQHDCVVILDVGKTLSKLTIWSADNELLDRREHRNSRTLNNAIPVLDVKGIGFWLTQTLAAFSRLGEIRAIIPVGHGAAGCAVDGDDVVFPPIDYEATPPQEVVERYTALRDPFAVTGSPRLPSCLNLGMQLFWRQTNGTDGMRRGQIVTWPQFWAWYLSGVAASEVTSLGCHTDLWNPVAGKPSPMAMAQGWGERLAPLRGAAEELGPVKPNLRERCGLPEDCMVLCGLHDSNATLLATYGYPEIGGRECTVLSTGTWFVAMRSMAADAAAEQQALPEGRDCLMNVNVAGRIVPSARFIGGREVGLLEAAPNVPADPASNPNMFISIACSMAKAGVFALPSFQKGVGPYPDKVGTWIRRPADQLGRRAVAGLYLALMADVALDLIGSRQSLVIEGRFGRDPVFTRALAKLRSSQTVYLSDPSHSIPFGALRLARPGAVPRQPLTPVEPMACDLSAYAATWRTMAETPR